jgi:hypothetical protein
MLPRLFAWMLLSTLVVGLAHSQQAGFTLKVSLMDFMMIQRGLMLLPDEHAQETLASVREQIQKQAKDSSAIRGN